MKQLLAMWMVALGLLAACNSTAPTAKEEAEEPEAIAITRWTDKTELFAEHPPLVSGQTARFAVHLTDLRTFKALLEGRVTVELRAAGGGVETFRTEAPSRPGIFGVDVKPATAGTFTMSIHLDSASIKDSHVTGPVQVYASAQAAAEAPAAEEADAISFLKEQQWVLDFATGVVAERGMRESLRVPAEVRARSGGEAQVTAPVAGRISAASAIPAVGALVQKGQVLARVIPRTAAPADRASLEAMRSEARTALGLATGNRERAERLLAAGAIPQRRVDEAKAAEATAQAQADAAQARIAQHESSRSGDGETAAEGQFALRAPISGVVAESRGAAGATVEEGASLFRIVATDSVYVAGHIPEADGWKLRQVSGGEVELDGGSERRTMGRLVSVSRVVDAQSRTLPVIFEVQNADGRLAVGQSTFVRLFTKPAASLLALPESALVDDGGQTVVFVQVGGESFARRAVRVGARDSGFAQVLEGVKPGDRVVTRGAYQVRLAAMSSSVPAHGHVH